MSLLLLLGVAIVTKIQKTFAIWVLLLLRRLIRRLPEKVCNRRVELFWFVVKDPKAAVLNLSCRTLDVSNPHVVDRSFFPSNAQQRFIRYYFFASNGRKAAES